MSLAHRLGFAALACLFAAPLPAGAALIMHKDLSLDIAKTIAEGAIAACNAKGYGTSAVVVDRDGDDDRCDARRHRLAAHHGERAAQGLHRDDLQAADGGIRQEALGSRVGRAPAGDVAERHRHSAAASRSRPATTSSAASACPARPASTTSASMSGLEKVKDQLQ